MFSTYHRPRGVLLGNLLPPEFNEPALSAELINHTVNFQCVPVGGNGGEGEGGGGRGEGRTERRGKVSTLACTRVRMVYFLHIMPHTATRTALRRLSNTPHTTHHYTTTSSKYGGMSSTLPSLFHVTHPDSTTIPSSRTTRFISLAAGARRCLYSPRRWDNATSSQTKEKVPSA